MTYWTKGIVYCTCGTCLRPSDKTRKVNKDRFDVQSIPNYVIKIGRSHGVRPTSRPTKQGKRITHPCWTDFGIALVIENHRSKSDGTKNTTRCGCSRRPHLHRYSGMAQRRENDWVLVLNSSGPNGPMNQREDDHEAIKIKERFFEESGKGNTGLHPSEQLRQRPSQPFSHSEGTERGDPKTGWKWYPSAASSSSSSSWWQSSDKWWQASSWDEQGIFSLLIPVSRCFTYRQWRYVCRRRVV